jgi:hypothetical protein
MDELLKSLIPLGLGAVGIPALLWRIYRWIDVKTREQITDLEDGQADLRTRIASLEMERETIRQLRLVEVDAERARRIAAEDDAALHRVQARALAEEIRHLQLQLERTTGAGT